ncbi:hypothetical protein ACX6XY_12450 [Streptomyces sp. O3]
MPSARGLRRVQLDPDADTWSDCAEFGGPAGAAPPSPVTPTAGREIFALSPGDGSARPVR